jgi:hypothetical protein
VRARNDKADRDTCEAAPAGPGDTAAGSANELGAPPRKPSLWQHLKFRWLRVRSGVFSDYRFQEITLELRLAEFITARNEKSVFVPTHLWYEIGAEEAFRRIRRRRWKRQQA